MEKKPVKDILIMGIGNLLLADDGVGVHAVKALMNMDFPSNVQVLDVGMSYLQALPWLEMSKRIIILDAMKSHGEPGTIYRIPLQECSSPERIDSLHNLDVFRMLALSQNKIPNSVIVFGVEPYCIEWGMELSDIVSESIPLLLKAVWEEIMVYSNQLSI